MKLFIATFLITLFTVSAASPLDTRAAIPAVDYDVLVIGGGPSGLSALSGLARVRRRAILLDSGVYRNGATRHMHDVIGSDGVVPAVFREKARQGISRYDTVKMQNATVTTIQSINNGSYFKATDTNGTTYLGRKVVLGTGLEDIIPATPGLKEAFGKGIYWCPWCDGFEHRDQPFGIIGPVVSTVGDVLEIHTLNLDVILFTNGTYTDESMAALDNKTANWRQQLKANNVTIEDRIILNITRTQNSDVFDPPGSDAEHDKFLVYFVDGNSRERGAFLTDFTYKQAASLGDSLGVEIKENKMVVDFINGMRTRVNGVFAVGDANNDGSTNVVHAMFSGKRAAVSIHVELAKEDVTALIPERDLEEDVDEEEVLRLMGRELEELWDEMS